MRPSLKLSTFASDADTAHADKGLITYIDLFILTVTLFVMLFVINRPDYLSDDQSEFQSLAMAQASSINKSENLKNEITTVDVLDLTLLTQSASVSSHSKQTSEKSLPKMAKLETPTLEHMADSSWMAGVKVAIKKNHLEQQIQLEEQSGFIAVHIRARVLFNSGEVFLARSGGALLDVLLPALKQTKGLIIIEGHTDDQPITSKQYPSNWELASAMAREVLDFFVSEGMNASRFRAVSYGASEPLVPNDSEMNRRKNRRVSLLIQQ